MLRTIPRWRLASLCAARPVMMTAWPATVTTTTVSSRTMATKTTKAMTTATATKTRKRANKQLESAAAAAAGPVEPPSSPPQPPEPIQLRAYQEECIQAVLAARARGQSRVGISLATGAGKTVVFTQLIDRIRPADPARTQTLILAHRRELVEQAARHCARAYPAATVEIEMGNLRTTGAADITVASVQTLATGGGRRLGKFAAARHKLVLVDEAHHIVAGGYRRVLEHFGLDEKGGGTQGESPLLVGVSATFSRFDGVALGTAIDEIVYHRDYVDLIGDGWLADVVFTTVASTADLSRVKTTKGASDGDYRVDDLSKAVNTPQVNDITVRTWLARAGPASDTPRHSTLVFCVDRRHVRDLTNTFRRHGIEAQYVTAETPKEERAHWLTEFAQQKLPVLLNCGVFTEGTDLPAVDCVMLARPTRSRNLLIQMIGRGLRRHAAKTNCHVIDMVASLAGGVVTTPTLFGLAPETLVEGVGVGEMRAMKETAQTAQKAASAADAPSAAFRSLRVTDYDSVFDLLQDTADARPIHALSPNAWVAVGPGRYVLSGPTGSYLRIEALDPPDPHANIFRAVEVRALPRGVATSPFAAPRELCRGANLAPVVRGADSYAAKATGAFPRNFVYRYMRWRKDAASDGQRAFLEKIVKELPEELTRGQAADMITKLKHGARGRFAALAVAQRKRARDTARKGREDVTVGPLSA